MLTIDIDYKYPTRPPRFYADTASCLMSMANPKSGGVKNDWIVEVYALCPTLFAVFALRGRDRDNPSLRGRSTANFGQRNERAVLK